MKRILIILLAASSIYAQAFELTQENLWEITACWRRIFSQEMLKMQSQEKIGGLKSYRKQMLAIEQSDAIVAGQLIATLCKGSLWEIFLEEKSVDATIDYIDYLMRALNLFISPGAVFRFPLKLQDLHAYINEHGCDEQELCAKVRQAFLAFTIIVSKMDYLAGQ